MWATTKMDHLKYSQWTVTIFILQSLIVSLLYYRDEDVTMYVNGGSTEDSLAVATETAMPNDNSKWMLYVYQCLGNEKHPMPFLHREYYHTLWYAPISLVHWVEDPLCGNDTLCPTTLVVTILVFSTHFEFARMHKIQWVDLPLYIVHYNCTCSLFIVNTTMGWFVSMMNKM